LLQVVAFECVFAVLLIQSRHCCEFSPTNQIGYSPEHWAAVNTWQV
jgi:hypothetical protein